MRPFYQDCQATSYQVPQHPMERLEHSRGLANTYLKHINTQENNAYWLEQQDNLS
jgi:hypothetical protein